ncbi:hypothetical protein Nepgr_024864 [Nepenthes gracilis]|uniref:Exostosin GT47 domain-containing protein n=1 Tax=Nepenthes gracilis TaxID=150966 RepID=A0AAD3T5K1_NEPGR|nr:hypothetical protein Nepgr_024864 [Nepenthes gracilis]
MKMAENCFIHWWRFSPSRRRQSSSRGGGGGGVSLIPTSLAVASFVLVVLYISLTSKFLSHDRHRLTYPHDQAQSTHLTITQFSLVKDDQRQPQTTAHDYAPPLTLPPAVKLESTPTKLTSSHDHHHQKAQTDSSTKPEFPSTGSNVNNHEVFHEEDIFLKNYKEMNKSLKIYVYPHRRSDPFANALLPVNKEPGGNYASETYFKNVLMNSHFITKDPSKANLFFLPFSIASLRNDRRIGVGGLPGFIRDYIFNISMQYPYWNRTGGADHFYVACHSVSRLAMHKADRVKLNAIQVVCSSSYFLPNYVTHKDLALPQIWPRHGSPDLNSAKRTKLAFFAGAMNSPVRRKLVQAWKDDPEIFTHSGRLKTPYADQLLGSKFCLHVKGFEVNTARIGDSLYYGCIPVILADYYDLPFMDILNWKSFSVVVTAMDIPLLKKILKSISSEDFSVLQGNVLKVRKHFQWNRSPVDYDAFYMVMYELWQRRSSIRVLVDDDPTNPTYNS